MAFWISYIEAPENAHLRITDDDYTIVVKRTVQIYLVFLKQGNRPQQDVLLFYKRVFFTGPFVSIGKVTSGQCVFVPFAIR